MFSKMLSGKGMAGYNGRTSALYLDGIEDHLVTSLGADEETEPEVVPLFHDQGPMDLDLNEEHFEVHTEHDLVPPAMESMAALPINISMMRRPVQSRGHNRARWARNGIPEKMNFNNHGQPVEPAETVARFSRFLGMIAKESSLFPINTQDWRAFYAGGKVDNAWIRIRGTIDWSDPITMSNELKIRHVVEETEPEVVPLFHDQGPMDLDLNEEHFEVHTEHDLVPPAMESMAALPINISMMRRPVQSRGHNRARWARNGIPEKMNFNNHGQPVEPAETVARFSRFLGMIAKESSLFPINTQDWRAFYAGGKVDNAWIRIRGTIDWSDPITMSNELKIRHVVEMKLNDRWKHYKGELKKKWYTPFIGTEQRFACGDLRVNVHQWKLLVTLWDLPHNQERSVKAKQNRRVYQESHTCGTKSFAQVRFEFEQVNGCELDRLSFFTLTHTRPDGEPIDAKSAQIIADFKEKLKEYEDKNEEVTDVVRHKVYSEVLGPEKRNKVRGFGAGINWSDVPDIVTEERPISRGVKELRAAYELQAEVVKLAQQEVIMLRQEATEREKRWSLEASNLVENLRKEQVEAINMQKNDVELKLMAIKRGMIEFIAEFKNSKGKDNIEGGSAIAVLQSFLNKFDIGTTACGPSEVSRDEDHEVVEMDADNGALSSMPQCKPNN